MMNRWVRQEWVWDTDVNGVWRLPGDPSLGGFAGKDDWTCIKRMRERFLAKTRQLDKRVSAFSTSQSPIDDSAWPMRND